MAKSKSTKKSLVIVFIIVAAIAGFLFGKQYQSPAPANSQKIEINSIFQSQSATSQGTITKVDDNNITFIATNNQTGTFPLATRFTVYKFSKAAQAKAFSDVKDIELDKKVVIGFQLINNVYQITTITYPFIAPITPSPTATPTKKK